MSPRDLTPDVNHFYDVEVARLIHEKYGLTEMDALRAFIMSQSYRMLVDEDLHMTDLPLSASLASGKPNASPGIHETICT